MILNRVNLRRSSVTFMKYLDGVVSTIFQPKTLIWNKTHLRIKFAEFCTVNQK